MGKPIVSVGSMGGTIAMAPAAEGAGVSPALGAEDLVSAVPEIGELAEIRARSICNVGSPSMSFSYILEALAFAREEVDGGATGVVLTHGTDTLDETAYFLDLLWDRSAPIVLTGAMRSSEMPGADGPANLLASVVVACSEEVRDTGVLVVLDDEVHLASTVTKSHANAVSTFVSPDWGPIARVYEKRVRVRMRPKSRHPALGVPEKVPARVPIFELGLDDDGRYIAAAASAGADGVIIAGAGAGHVPAPVVDVLDDVVAQGISVILCTRQGSGTTAVASYDYPGSEMDLFRRGLIGAGYLSPRKARILLLVLIAVGATEEEIRRQFALRGE